MMVALFKASVTKGLVEAEGVASVPTRCHTAEWLLAEAIEIACSELKCDRSDDTLRVRYVISRLVKKQNYQRWCPVGEPLTVLPVNAGIAALTLISTGFGR